LRSKEGAGNVGEGGVGVKRPSRLNPEPPKAAQQLSCVKCWFFSFANFAFIYNIFPFSNIFILIF
jgi:hypothetical protein